MANDVPINSAWATTTPYQTYVTIKPNDPRKINAAGP